jgi:hypothetical protein
MNCPNCGFEQPEAHEECARCGIVFKKYRERLDLVRDPEAAIRKIVASQAGRIKNKKIFFAPEIPEEALSRVWLRFAYGDIVDPSEEVLMFGSETDGPAEYANGLIVTSRGILVSAATKAPVGFDYGKIKEMGITGLVGDTLTIDGQKLSFVFLAGVQGAETKLMDKMFRDILRLSRSAVQSGNWKPRAPVALDRETALEGFALRQAGKEPISIADAEVLAKGQEEKIEPEPEPIVAEEAETFSPADHDAPSGLPGARAGAGSPGLRAAETACAGDRLTRQGGGGGYGASAQPARAQGSQPAPVFTAQSRTPEANPAWRIIAQIVGIVAGSLIWTLAKSLLASKFNMGPFFANLIGVGIGLYTWLGVAKAFMETFAGKKQVKDT